MPVNNDSRGPRTKFWCFTLNNYTDADVIRLRGELTDVDYIIFGREVGASGTPHLQGTVCFSTRKRLTEVKRVIGQSHLTSTRHLNEAIEYCKKDQDFEEYGHMPHVKPPGKRNDMEDFKNSVKEGCTEFEQLRELHSRICAQYPQFVNDYVVDKAKAPEVVSYPLRPWQAALNEELNRAADTRTIRFIVDIRGNQGKSWFTRYYYQNHDNVQILLPGKKADMALMVNESCNVFFLDCCRSKQGVFIQYDFLEELKNGLIMSGKYHSKMKTLKSAPHIVVMMNEPPDMTKLSRDRYNITTLG